MAIGDESLFRTDQSKLYVGIDNFGYSVPPGQAKDIVSQRSLPDSKLNISSTRSMSRTESTSQRTGAVTSAEALLMA